jgi:hypothetical protein
MLKISMVSERYYERSFRALGAPDEAHELVETAKFLFDGASVGFKADDTFPAPQAFEDGVNASHTRWESLGATPDEHERLGLTMVSNSLIIALEHRHPGAASPYIRRRLTVVIGAQDVTLFSSVGGRPERREGPHSHDVVGEFAPRMDSAMGRIGLRTSADTMADAY